MFQRIRFIGCGTGRCGTVSLAKIVGACNNMWCYHETLPALDWKVNEEQFQQKFVWFNSSKKSIGDVAYWYLPYLEKFIEKIPDIKIIIIYRNQKETINSWLRWFPENVFLGQTHRKSYPNIGIDNHKEAIKRYWEYYYSNVYELKDKYPNNIMIMKMEDLNAPDKMFSFIGICPKDRRYIDNIIYNEGKIERSG